MTGIIEVAEWVHHALDDAQLPHALGGALAMAYATDEPRGTADVDVNVFVPEADARRVLEALPKGTVWDDADLALLTRDGQVRVFLEGYPVDVFLSNTEFHAAVAERVRVVPFGSSEVPILHGDDLSVFKIFFNRRKDWGDLESMFRSGKVNTGIVLERVIDVLGEDDARVRDLRTLIAEVS